MNHLPIDVLQEVVWHLDPLRWAFYRLVARLWMHAVNKCWQSVKGIQFRDLGRQCPGHLKGVLKLCLRACTNLQFLHVHQDETSLALGASPLSALHVAVTPSGDTLRSVLQHCPKSLTHLGARGWKDISSCLGGLSLAQLDISYSAEAHDALLGAISQQTALTSLCLCDVSPATGFSASVPANLLTPLRNLQHIWIDDMSNECLAALTSSFHSLQSLHADGYDVCLSSATAVAFLSKFPMLSALSFHGQDLLGGPAYIDALCRLQFLRYLDVCSETLEAEAYAKLLENFQKLKVLVLGTNADDAVIMSALRNNSALTHLALISYARTPENLSGECFRYIAARCSDRVRALEVWPLHPDCLILLDAHPHIASSVMNSDVTDDLFGFAVRKPFVRLDDVRK